MTPGPDLFCLSSIFSSVFIGLGSLALASLERWWVRSGLEVAIVVFGIVIVGLACDFLEGAVKK